MNKDLFGFISVMTLGNVKLRSWLFLFSYKFKPLETEMNLETGDPGEFVNLSSSTCVAILLVAFSNRLSILIISVVQIYFLVQFIVRCFRLACV